MKKNLLVVLLGLSIGLCAGYGHIQTVSAKNYRTPIKNRSAIATTTVVENSSEFVGGNISAPKENAYDDWDDYELFGGFSEEDIDLMAAVVYYEAGNQSIEGKEYVVDVILNRLDDSRFPDSIEEIISAPGQFVTYKKASIMADTCIPLSCYGAVINEVHERQNYEILFFSSEGYNGKTPLFKYEDHYFSK